MIRRPPRSTRTYTLFPYATLFRSVTRPGHRLPHAWLEGAEGRVSTLDLVGRGGFTLFVASDESEWRRVGDEAAAQSGVPLRVVLVGEGGYRDAEGNWARVRGTGRSEERRVRKECVSKGRTRGAPCH